MRLTLVAAIFVACMTSQSGRAEGRLQSAGDGSIQSDVSSIIGTGVHTGQRIAPNIRLRLDSGFVVAHTTHIGDLDSGMVRKRFVGTMVDFYPLGGEGFHLSAGGRLDNRRKVKDLVTTNALLYAPRGFSTQKSGLSRLASTMTVGYGSSPEPGVSVGLEAGAMLEHGDPATRELNRFAHRGTRNDMRFASGQRFNPVVQASLGYKF